MSSHSIRIPADLFELARRQGKESSRSVAQQLEHGACLDTIVETNGANGDAPAVPDAQLWAHKRAQQQRDIARITAGQSTNEAMSWFSGGRARQAKAVNSPL